MAIFDDNAEARPENFLATLVGEDKKFKTPEDLAKGKWESDNYIASQKQEIEDLRSKIAEQARIEDLLAQWLPNQNRGEPEANQPAQAEANTPLSKEDLAKLVRELNEEDSRTRTVQQNRDTVSAKLTDIYGSEDKAAQAVQARAHELGVTVQFLRSVAEQSPTAFFVQLGVEPSAKPQSKGPTHSEVNPAAFGKSNTLQEGTYDWWKALRKSDPKAYERLTLKRHEDAIRMGDAFYT